MDNANAIRGHVLRAVGANRTPGFHFPGHFLDIRWAEVSDDGRARLTMDSAPQLLDHRGAVDLAALAVLADTALATAARARDRSAERLGTTHLHLQFSGAPAVGDVGAQARLLDFTAGAALEQALVATTLVVAGQSICHATGEFVSLEAPPGTTLAPLPWQRFVAPQVAAIDEASLAPDERRILEMCDRALAFGPADASFLRRFWGGRTTRNGGEAHRRIVPGPHMSNRVGHAQGGILLGLAAATACDAAPGTMRLANVSAWYLRPGRKAELDARSRAVHIGRNTALVRTTITASNGATVLEAVSQHVAQRPTTASPSKAIGKQQTARAVSRARRGAHLE